MGFSIQHGFDFEAAEKANDDHTKLSMALKALPTQGAARSNGNKHKFTDARGNAHKSAWVSYAAIGL
jgi:hypothetical protein